MRVVVDTNIWLSALFTPDGFSARILPALADRLFIPVFTSETLLEFKDAATDSGFLFRSRQRLDDLNRIIGLIVPLGVEMRDVEVAPLSRDPKDDIFIALAVASQADYLVTRDDDLKGDGRVREYLAANGVQLVTVREFVEVLEQPAL